MNKVKISHEQYLKQELAHKQAVLREESVQFRILCAEHDLKAEMLRQQIHSLEHQLDAQEE